VHGFIGLDALKSIIDICGDDTAVFVVTELTHPGGLEFTRPLAEQFASMAAFLGCYGIQAPGTRPEQIAVLRKVVGPDMCIASCGIGAQGGSFTAALEAGADFGIIGRAIYAADDPGLAAEEFARSGSRVSRST
jgi:orotidine-5'-phosphate decarboxylase